MWSGKRELEDEAVFALERGRGEKEGMGRHRGQSRERASWAENMFLSFSYLCSGST